MFFNKPPGGGLFGLPFSQQINNFDALTSSSQPQKLLPGEWDWQKKKPPIVDLITGLANMFGKPADTPEFTLQQPTFGLPTTTPPYVAQPPQDKTGWGDWMGNWGLQRSDLGDLPQYPSPNDPFALGKQTGDMIRKTWHDVHKDYAFNTIQENFPDLDISQPQPDQSYHDFFDGIKRQIDAMPSHLLAAMQRADSSEASDDPELDRRQPPYPDWPKDQMPPSPFDPNRPPLPAPEPEPEEYGPDAPKDLGSQKPPQQQIPLDPRKISPTPQAKTLDWSLEAAGAIGGSLTSKAIDMIGKPIANEITEKEFQQHMQNIDDMIKVNKDAGNDRDVIILENIKKLDQKMRTGSGKSDGVISFGDRGINELTRSQLINALKNGPEKDRLPK